jgi:hypothetical protein
MVERRLSAWLRSALALFGIAGILLLAGCGGGSGAPNNPYLPPPPPIPPLLLLPSTLVVYAGTPATLTVSGGVPPYRAFSTDASILPVPANVSGDTIVLSANNVIANTVVAITVQDAAGTVSAPATISVRPAALLASGITITSNPNPACVVAPATLCSGSTGTATVQVTGNGGAGIAGRAVKFDVVQGSFSIVSTNPAQPLVPTLTVSTDGNGNAIVILSVPANTPTQSGIIRATDVASGNQITGNFVIQQITVGGETLAVLPGGDTTITGPDNAHCSSGVTLTYYIFGGTPPYTVSVGPFAAVVTLSTTRVLTSGGSFNLNTNGSCFENLTFVVTDATGLTIPTGNSPTVTNELGENPPAPPPPGPFTVTPGAIAKNNCVPANTFQFVMTGGVAPYSVVTTSTSSPTSPVLEPQTGLTAGAAVTVSGLTSPSTTTITGFDSSVPPQAVTVSISCTGAPPPPVGATIVISPANGYNYLTSTCVNKVSNFVIVSGGTPPYTVFFASGGTGATITPTTVANLGQGFTVTGLTDIALTTNITVADSSTPQVQAVTTITCPTGSSSPAMAVEPAGGYTYSIALSTPPGTGCSNKTSNFVITGGTPPYSAFFSVPGTVGFIAPATIVASGQGFSVTGLANVAKLNQITIRDSSNTQQILVRTITCTP